MELPLVPLHYLLWHYTVGIRDLFAIVGNVLWFIYEFFSIPILLRTFFSPWKRISEGYAKKSGAEAYFSAIIVNLIMRIVGMLMRTMLILVGLLLIILLVLLSGVLFLVWLATPLLIVLLFLAGIRGLLILI